jgi:hypothetical protein
MPEPEQLDPSQRAAVPLKPMSPGELLHKLKAPETHNPTTPEGKKNKARASAEMASIIDLQGSRAFEWFFDEFIEKPYRLAFDRYRSPSTPEEQLVTARADYLALRTLRVGMLEREIAHRRQLDKNDLQISVLEEKLRAL